MSVGIMDWFRAAMDSTSDEADAVVEALVADELYKYVTIRIYLKGGRTLTMRSWVVKDQEMSEHALWTGLKDWLNDPVDVTPYFFHTNDGYQTCIVKSEITQIELVEDKDTK